MSAAPSAPRRCSIPKSSSSRPLARALGAPIKWIEDRVENFTATVLERREDWDMEAACDGDGRLLGIRGHMRHDHGANTPYGVALPYNAATNLIGPYVLPSCDLAVSLCLTNFTPAAPTRGAGRPQGTFVMERLLDAIAETARADPRRGAPAQSHPAGADAVQHGRGAARRQRHGLRQRRLSRMPAPRARRRRLERFRRPPRRRARARPLYRHRPVQLRRRDGQGTVRERVAAHPSVGPHRDRDRRDRARAGRQDHAGADRGRHPVRVPRSDTGDRRRHGGVAARARRLCQPSGGHRGQCRPCRVPSRGRESNRCGFRDAARLSRRARIARRQGARTRHAGRRNFSRRASPAR